MNSALYGFRLFRHDLLYIEKNLQERKKNQRSLPGVIASSRSF